MSFLKKTQKPEFWTSFLKFTIPFFVIVIIFSLILNSWDAIFAGDFTKISETNFNEGKWLTFFVYKIIFSLLYGLYITNKNIKS